MIGYGAVATMRFPRNPLPSAHSSHPRFRNRVSRSNSINGVMPVGAVLAELDQDIATIPRCEFHGTVHARPRTPNLGLATVRFTSGQLGKPNNDHGCPQERLF